MRPRRSTAFFLLSAVCALASAALLAQSAAPPDPLVRENVTVKLAAHSYVIPDGNVGLVPNVGIVVGSRGTLVIDPGLGRRNGETVLREVAKISKNGDLYIASTHFHAEHTTGYIAFPASAKYINSTVQEAEFEEGGMRMVAMFSGRSPATAEILKDAGRRPAAITFDRTYTLDLGDVRVRFLVVGPTHTRGDTAFFVEGDNVLFAGDVIMNNSFLAASAVSSMRAWLMAFDTLEALKPRTIVPAHGEYGPGTIVATNRRIMQAVQALAHTLKAEGRSSDDVASIVQSELQTQYPGFPRANGLATAARSAYAEAP